MVYVCASAGAELVRVQLDLQIPDCCSQVALLECVKQSLLLNFNKLPYFQVYFHGLGTHVGSSSLVRILHIGVRAQGRTGNNTNSTAEGKQGHSRRRPALGRPGTGRSREVTVSRGTAGAGGRRSRGGHPSRHRSRGWCQSRGCGRSRARSRGHWSGRGRWHEYVRRGREASPPNTEAAGLVGREVIAGHGHEVTRDPPG